MAEQLGRVAWSKSDGHHVEFRTVRFEPGTKPIRVRITRADFGRIENPRDAQRVLNRIHAQLVEGYKLEDILARYVRKKLGVNLFIRRWATFCESKLPKVRAGRLAARRVRELELYVQRGYFDCWAETAVQEIGELELLEWVEWMRTPKEKARGGVPLIGHQDPRSRAPRPISISPSSPAPDHRAGKDCNGKLLSEKTLRNVLADIGQFLRWLHARGVIQRMPRVPTSELVLEEYAPTIPDAATVARILAEIPAELRGVFLARSYMGLRPSEARRLDVADLRDEGRAIQVLASKSKKRKARLLTLAPPVLEWLAAVRDLAHAFPAEPLFPNPRADNAAKRWTEKCEWDAFKRACRLAGVGDWKPNESGRHFFATEYVNQGVDVFAVKSWLGHSDIATTARYAKLRPQTLANVVKLRSD